MQRWLALLGVVMLLSVSADGLVHDHGLDGAHPTCVACQARNAAEAPSAAVCVAVPAPPLPIEEAVRCGQPRPDPDRYRLAPKTSPPFPAR